MASKKAVRAAARSTVRTTSKAGATPNEGRGLVKRAARQGQLADWVVKDYRQAVRKELGAAAAQRAVRSLKTIDNSPKKAAVAKNAAKRTAARLNSTSRAKKR